MRWFIGDIHGCREELDELLEKIGREDLRPEIYTTGDAIGKGPDPAGVLRMLRKEGVRSVLGNHEAHFLAAGTQGDSAGELAEFADEIAAWPLYLELGDIDLVHAGLQPGKERLEQMDRRVLLTVRTWDGEGKELWREGDPPWFDRMVWPRKVVFGHWAYQMPHPPPGFYGLDTGCVYGGWLTAWCAEEDRWIRVMAHREWAPGKK